MEFKRDFTAREIQESIGENAPSRRMIREALNSMEQMGFLKGAGGDGRAPRHFSPVKPQSGVDPGGYSPRESSQKSVIPYPGGKGSYANWIINLMPSHDTYVEVFGGGAGVLFNKTRSKYEIYNDRNDDLTQFFRIVRDRGEELSRWLQSVPYSRSVYKKWVSEFYRGSRPQDPIERAGRFFTLRYMQYAGVGSSANGFKTRARRSPARSFDNARRRIQSVTERFAQVTIEQLDYRDILQNYDDTKVDVLFYLDPPYAGTENHYDQQFDHDSLIEALREIENDWMLSCKEVPTALSDYTVRERVGRHRMRRASGTVTERIVCNFDPAERSSFD